MTWSTLQSAQCFCLGHHQWTVLALVRAISLYKLSAWCVPHESSCLCLSALLRSQNWCQSTTWPSWNHCRTQAWCTVQQYTRNPLLLRKLWQRLGSRGLLLHISTCMVTERPWWGLHGHPYPITSDPPTPNLGYHFPQNLRGFLDVYNRQDPPWLGG